MKYTNPIFLSLLIAFGLAGCNSSKPTSLFIVVSGDTAGWITPCGCTANQAGGLERRATLLKSLGPSDQVIYLDVGGSAAGKSEYQQVKLQSILQGDKLMGLEVHNVGAPETQLSPDTLMKIGRESKTQWMSTNLQTVGANDPSPSFMSPHLLVTRHGARILVMGVIDPDLVKSSQWKAKDASSSVLNVLENVKADITIVLAYMDEPKLRSLAESLPEVDYIVGGPTGQMLAPSKVGPVGIMSATNKGKFLARIEFEQDGKKWKSTKPGAIEVSSSLDRDALQTKNFEAYLSELAKYDFPASKAGLINQTPTVAPSQHYRIAGTESCTSCHQQSHDSWVTSKHSHAWKTLVEKRSHVDPSCQQCHTTGYGIPGGFEKVAGSETIVNVGCESCHGPSKAHAMDPKIKTTYLSRDQCVRCHDHENSPEFKYETYWAKVIHSK